ncbi:protoporphyrinogen oxidase HemJ [Taklimakanibacter lacteus]|uniref:protoporphyrinogen oxidase HemJ n=1 Tax=Taklimakanibacter lacteus TaxID=2268456 RepID=UPI000E668D65
MAYLWLKAFHIIAVVAWMAGLFYLPRLMVYHRRTAIGGETSEMFKVMERRLLRAIMYPAMGMSWLLGLALIWVTDAYANISLWLVVKLIAVVAMTGFHQWLAKFVKAFGEDERPRDERFFRMINEIPTVLLIVIVIMAVVKP